MGDLDGPPGGIAWESVCSSLSGERAENHPICGWNGRSDVATVTGSVENDRGPVGETA